jgi:hypothetical protein
LESGQAYSLTTTGYHHQQHNSSQPHSSFQLQHGGGDGLLLLACQHCPFTAPSHAELTSHLTALHRDLKPPTTRDGGASIGGGVKLEGFLYPCEKCEFRTSTAQALRKHRQTAHSAADTAVDAVNRDGGGSSSSVRYMCTKCEYSSPSRINFKAHVSRAHHAAKTDSGNDDAAVKKDDTPSSDGGVGFLPLYHSPGGGEQGAGGALMRLQPPMLPVYHLTVKGPEHHIFTFHPAPPSQQPADVSHTHHQSSPSSPQKGGAQQPPPPVAFLPVVSGKTGEGFVYHHQQGPPVTTSTSAVVVSEAVWRPEYDSYLSSV